MKTALILIASLLSAVAFAQRGGGAAGAGGPPAGVGRPDMSTRMPTDAGRPSPVARGALENANSTRPERAQQPLRDAQVNGGAFRMLEQNTGMTADQLKTLYGSSGAMNFGQFASALMVSKNLGLDTDKVLGGLKTQSLGKTLQSLGIAPDTAKEEVRKAEKQVKTAS